MTANAAINSHTSFARRSETEVDALFLERWSRRALSPRPLSAQQIATLFEAARWAPSAGNSQPWLFVYASQAETLAKARTLLKEANQRWAAQAPLLVFVFARKRHADGVPADEYESIAGIAIGYPGERAALPSDLHDKEQPNTRRSVRDFVFEGRYEREAVARSK